MGLVCFRLKGSNERNQKLLSNINASGKLHMVPASVHGRYVIRFCVCAQDAKESDIDFAWDTITDMATELIESEIIIEKSGVPLPILESSKQENGQVMHKVEMAELMELMERTHLPTRQVTEQISVEEPAELSKPKTKLAKRLSKRQFSFTDTIEFVGMANTREETINP